MVAPVRSVSFSSKKMKLVSPARSRLPNFNSTAACRFPLTSVPLREFLSSTQYLPIFEHDLKMLARGFAVAIWPYAACSRPTINGLSVVSHCSATDSSNRIRIKYSIAGLSLYASATLAES